MDYDKATAVSIPVWQDPQSFVITVQARDEIWAYFELKKNDGSKEKKIAGCLHFKGVWALKTNRFKNLHYYPNVVNDNFNGYYLIVQDSSWLTSLFQERDDCENYDWKAFDKTVFHHYIVQSNKHWVDIVAKDVNFLKIKMKEIKQIKKIWKSI
jgi:hypothetical protein